MTEISRTDLLEYPRNAANDVLSIKKLGFKGELTSSSSGSTFVLKHARFNSGDIGKKVELKHPTDLTKYETKTITAVDGVTITVDSSFSNTYIADSRVYVVLGERDIFDSAIADRTATNIMFIEDDFTEED